MAVESDAPGPESRELIDQVARLIEFLRDLARSRQPRTLNIREFPQALFLDDLPLGIDIDTEAYAGDKLFSMEQPVIEPPPQPPADITEFLDDEAVSDSSTPPSDFTIPAEEGQPHHNAAFERWLPSWKVWAEVDREQRPHRDWYRRLVAVQRELEQHDDELELVLGTGLLTWKHPERTLAHPLVTTPLAIDVDPSTRTITVRIAGGVSSRFVDRDLLDSGDEFDAGGSETIRQQYREEAAHPLTDDHKERLTQWRNNSFSRCRSYTDDWGAPEPSATPQLTASPVLILKPRDQSAFIEYLNQMTAVLTGPDARAPLGLAQLLTAIETEQRLEWLMADGAEPGEHIGEDPLFPKPTNREQAMIMERLKDDNGVVVQGPPGTGKTHTIANLISALLARGQRVLVTSQKAQALRVLHHQLPDEIQTLCVSMADIMRGGSVELDRSVGEISSRFDQFSPEASQRRVDELDDGRRQALKQVAAIKEQLRSLRESETYIHPPVAPGYEGTLGGIVQKLRAAAPRFQSWVPVPFPAAAGVMPPLRPEELTDLWRLHRTATPERRARKSQTVPAHDEVPSAARVEQLVEAAAQAQHVADDASTDLSAVLSRLPGDIFDDIEVQCNEVDELLGSLGILTESRETPDWVVELIADTLAGRNTVVWRDLRSTRQTVDEINGRMLQLRDHKVVLPDLPPNGPGGIDGQAGAVRALAEYLRAGKKLKKRRQPSVQQQAEPILMKATVDGLAVTDLKGLRVVGDHLDVLRLVPLVEERWIDVGLKIDASQSLTRRVAALDDATRSLTALIDLVPKITGIGEQLKVAGIRFRPLNLEEWHELIGSIEAAGLARAADAARNELEELAEQLQRFTSTITAPPPELSQLATSIRRRDSASYRTLLDALDQARSDHRDQVRADELHSRLSSAHLPFAEALQSSADDEEWAERIAAITEAWAWGRAWTFFLEQREPGRDRELERDLKEANQALGQATATLAAAKAWEESLSRMSVRHAQALRAYQAHISDRGKGTGKYASRYERAAREAMEEARGAVPAWIMPINEVLQTIPPDQNSFDVVIIDEASQAGIDALFLLWLAPRVIVVGDDRQCAPSQIKYGELQAIFDRIDDYLGDVPDYLRTALTPRSSLFSLLTSRFGSVIRLREHFRSMPEIIGWSSQQFYQDQPLVPLRQYGVDRLPPLRTTRVMNAFNEGTSSSLRNPEEAQALVDQVVACLHDEQYRGKDFGVVTLQGSAQAKLIENRLEEVVPPDVWDARRLRIGSPPDFQGDERDVIFLSMIVAEPRTSMTGREAQRRFNVAASRARDQLWLFHSVATDALRGIDLRRSLLSYALNPPEPYRTDPLTHVTANERCDPFDSLFEQRVFLEIRDRGFSVVPQFEVNGRRIDLVVIGAEGRLAVECDGDAWHSSPEQRFADMERELELNRCGWEFWRVRESEFYFDRDAAMSTLWEQLERRGIRPGEGTPASEAGSGGGWDPLPELTDEERLEEFEVEDP